MTTSTCPACLNTGLCLYLRRGCGMEAFPCDAGDPRAERCRECDHPGTCDCGEFVHADGLCLECKAESERNALVVRTCSLILEAQRGPVWSRTGARHYPVRVRRDPESHCVEVG